MIRALTLLTAAAFPLAGLAQSAEPDMEQLMLQQQASQVALFECVRGYALKYVKTPAAPQDVAEAAISACDTENSMLLASTAKMVGSVDAATVVLDHSQRTAQRAAVRLLLEARHGIH